MPLPTGDWVLIKVKAFGLNRSELMTRKGYSPQVKFPRVLGIECVGEVAQDPVGEFSSGQKVAAFMGGMGRDLMAATPIMRCFPSPCFIVSKATCLGNNSGRYRKCSRRFMALCTWP